MTKAIREDQVHRILEDIESLALGSKHMADMIAFCKDPKLKTALLSGANLQKNLLDAVGRDITGMMNGNDKTRKG